MSFGKWNVQELTPDYLPPDQTRVIRIMAGGVYMRLRWAADGTWTVRAFAPDAEWEDLV